MGFKAYHLSIMAKKLVDTEVQGADVEIVQVDKDCSIEVIENYKDLKIGQVYEVSASVANALLTKKVVKIV